MAQGMWASNPWVAGGITAATPFLSGFASMMQRGGYDEMLGEFRDQRDANLASAKRFGDTGRQIINSQGADIVLQSSRTGGALASRAGRSGSSGIARLIAAGARNTGANARANYVARAFPALGAEVARMEQNARNTYMNARLNMGPRPSYWGGFARGIPAAADLARLLGQGD